MAHDHTFGDLYKAKAILDAAVEAFMVDPTTYRVLVGEGHVVNPHAAVAASPFALGMMAKPEAKPGSKRSAMRTAILLSRPVKG